MMYLVAINWKASSSGSEESEDNPGLNGSMPASVVDELFKSRIMFDTITRSLERNLSGVASGNALRPNDIYTLSALMSVLMIDHGRFAQRGAYHITSYRLRSFLRLRVANG